MDRVGVGVDLLRHPCMMHVITHLPQSLVISRRRQPSHHLPLHLTLLSKRAYHLLAQVFVADFEEDCGGFDDVEAGLNGSFQFPFTLA